MKVPFEEHVDRFSKIIPLLLKFAVFVGGACVVAYSLRIGRFPQGLTLGDSLLLVMAAICFGAVASLFLFSLVGLGITLSPLVRLVFWITGKLVPRFAKTVKDAPYTLAPMSWMAVLGAIFAGIMILLLAQRDISLAWNLPLLSVALYFVYSVYVSASSQLKELSRIIDSPVETPLQADVAVLRKVESLKVARFAAPLFIVITPFVFGGATGEVLDASMRAAKIRIESPVVYIKQPYSSLMPKGLVAPMMEAPAGYVVYKGATVLFHGFGTVTVLAFKDIDRQRARTLDIPNDYLIVESN